MVKNRKTKNRDKDLYFLEFQSIYHNSPVGLDCFFDSIRSSDAVLSDKCVVATDQKENKLSEE